MDPGTALDVVPAAEGPADGRAKDRAGLTAVVVEGTRRPAPHHRVAFRMEARPSGLGHRLERSVYRAVARRQLRPGSVRRGTFITNAARLRGFQDRFPRRCLRPASGQDQCPSAVDRSAPDEATGPRRPGSSQLARRGPHPAAARRARPAAGHDPRVNPRWAVFPSPSKKQFPISFSSHARFAQDAKTQRIQGRGIDSLPHSFTPPNPRTFGKKIWNFISNTAYCFGWYAEP